MADARESDELISNAAVQPGSEWLGGEAFPGQDFQMPRTKKSSRALTNGEALVLCLGSLTIGTALGIFFGRSSR